jgi:hypothetical protein
MKENKKKDLGIFGNLFETLGIKHAWIFGIAALFIYKIIDMNTIQWFGKTIFITGDGGILGFLICAALFWSAVILIIFPILKFLGFIKDY